MRRSGARGQAYATHLGRTLKGITPEMLNGWWDHIGNTERFRLWQRIDHVQFTWTVAPTQPDLPDDIGAKQKVKEYVGKNAYTLYTTFVNTGLARIIQSSFFEDLGSHCLRAVPDDAVLPAAPVQARTAGAVKPR